jgi:peptidoglycan/xylan/chitin deacetylase (PgdA/CDA1 family)
MKGFINQNKINYILYHLGYIINIPQGLRDQFVFCKGYSEIKEYKNKIIFLLSDKELEHGNIFNINNVPILFPLSSEPNFVKYDNSNLIFIHDILKSAFYLLSGYQEYKCTCVDHLNRFPYEFSIQKKLGIIKKPIVNYYFELIANEIITFSKGINITIYKKYIFENYGFLLTHDIDRVDTYTTSEFIYRTKQLLGVSKTTFLSRKKIFCIWLEYMINLIWPFRKNHHWNFTYLTNIEQKYNIKSIFFFNQKGDRYNDGLFSIYEKRIQSLIKFLLNKGCEIGYHGTVKSAYDSNEMKNTLRKLQDIINQNIYGGRQHRLQFILPYTACFYEKNGIKYDSTLGFAAHEGFRNSYCLPFKLYDFENDHIINTWEYPLNIMDTTLYCYRKLNINEMEKSILEIILEIKKFHGLFTILWHNGTFEQSRIPGLKSFYENLLKNIMKDNPTNILGKDLIEILNQNEK